MALDSFLATVTAFDALPIPGFVFELDGTLVAVNDAAARLLGGGQPATALLGRKSWDFAPGGDLIWSDVIASAREAPFEGEITLVTPLGPRTLRYVMTLRNVETRTVAVVFGITMARLEPSIDHTGPGHRTESLGRVAGGIAHDFNNQLVSVLAEASAARENEHLSSSIAEALRRIEAAAQRMAVLTRQLLAYAGRGRVVIEVIEPDELVESVRAELQARLPESATVVFARVDVPVAVRVDRAQLREAIANVLVNAYEALGGKPGTVRLRASTSVEAGTTWWNLEVIDSGAGIEPAIAQQIFDPFFTTKPERHGLGLAVAQGVARRFGGQISFASRPGKGATFLVSLPTVEVPATPTKRPRSVSESAISLRGKAALVADDEPSVRATLRRLLERRGAAVVLAADGDEAAAALAAQSFDLVLLDVMMPHQTGYQLIPQVRRLLPEAKIILVSGYSDGASGADAGEPDAFLEKPFTTKQLDDMVDSVLES